MGFLSRLAGTAIAASLLTGGYRYLRQHEAVSAAFRLEPLSTALSNHGPGGEDGEHFSPAEDLERLEANRLKAAAARARRARRPLDIAMYAFTDRILAALLIREAAQGIVVRIYRDGEQYENEERNAACFRDPSTTTMFGGQRNIHVRVKPASRSDLMHLKAWSDGEALREGSANWSHAALQRQDNNVRFSRNSDEVKAFEAVFEAMWSRSSNTVVQ